MGFKADIINIEKTYKKMEKEEKREIKRLFRRLLENTTIPLDTLSRDVFQSSVRDLSHKKNWVNPTKKDKAGILSFYSEYDKKSDNLFLKLIGHLYINYENSKKEIKKDFWNKIMIYRGKKHQIQGIQTFFNKLKNPIKKYNNNLFMKFDIARSSFLLDKYPHKFCDIQMLILKEILSISKQYGTEMFLPEGDALYFIFNDAYKDYPRHCKNLVLFGIKVLQRMRYYNIYENPLKDTIELRIIGVSVPITGDDQKEMAKKRLSSIEKEYADPDCLFIDKFIAWKLPLTLQSRFSTKTILREGLLHYYKLELHFEKVELKINNI